MSSSYWIDTHTHLNMLKGYKITEVIQESKELGIERFINIGTDSKDHPVVHQLTRDYPEVYCTLGVHPHDAEDFHNAKDWMLDHLNDDKVVAVGEIGLDFYYDNAPRELQIQVFDEQMAIAADLGMPVEIHTRDAEDETIEILQKYKGSVRGLLHCFSGTSRLAQAAIDVGFNISISGIVTFKTAVDLRKTVKEVVPANRIHVETDAPFLAPVPVRGKENCPPFMLHTAEVVARLKGVTMEQLKELTFETNMDLFPKLD